MAQGTAGVKTFGSGETMKKIGTGVRFLKEGQIVEMQQGGWDGVGKSSTTFEQFCIHCNSHIFFINIETIDILLTQ